MEPEFTKYCQATRYCDCDHPDIVDVVRSIKKKSSSTDDFVVSLFLFARDMIKSGMDRFDVKASETLKKGFSGCVGKNNLLIAMFRQADIPARYAFTRMSKEVLRPLDKIGLSRLAFSKIPDYLPHVICSLYFREKWIYVDCSFDKEMYEMFFARTSDWKIDWDGKHDLFVAREYHDGEIEFFDTMDTQFEANFGVLPPLFLARPMLGIANVYSRGLRSRHRRIKNFDDQK